MLVPAQLYKEELKKELISRWYDPKYAHYFAGWRDELSIGDNANFRRDFAYIDDDGKLAGFFSYRYNSGDKGMDNFGLIGFRDNNIPMILEIKHHVIDMFYKHEAQRAEFWASADNPICKLYRRLANALGGKEVAHLHRTTFYEGKYHDSIVWEFLIEDVLPIIEPRYKAAYEAKYKEAKSSNHLDKFGNIADYKTIYP